MKSLNSGLKNLKLSLIILTLFLLTACGVVLPEDQHITQPDEATSTSFTKTTVEKTNTQTPSLTPTSTKVSATPTQTPIITPEATSTDVVEMGSEQSRPTITFGTFIEVVSDEPLTFEDTTPDGIQLRQLMDTSNTGDQLILLGWTENNEVVVRPGTVNLLSAEVGTTPTPEPETQWAINPETEQVRSIPEWPPKPIWTDAQQQLAEQISKDLPRQPGRTDLPVAKWFPSPDGQYLALSVDNKLHIYSVADGVSIATLPHENLEYDFGYIASGAFWSSDGSRLAYPVTTTDRVPYPGSSILEQVYQVHISGSDGSNLNRLVLPWFGGNPHVLGWSPDNQYLAITAQFEEKSTLHLYAVRLSDQTWVDLTPNVDFFAGARALFWSPNGKMIAYTNRANNAISVMTLKY